MTSEKPAVNKAKGIIKEFEYTGGNLKITKEIKDAFDRDGVFIIRNLFSKEEVTKITETLETSDILDRAWDLSDGDGRASRLLLWNQPGTDVTGMVARCEKMVNTCEDLMGGEVYHYHTKLMMKEAKFGGKHLWHQDYGYWYKNGCLTPDMLTVFVPLDRCTKQNGCLQVVPGTNRCGRIEHDLIAGQTMANQERVDMLLDKFPLVYVEAEPGDGIFFHCNLLHRSDRNESEHRRWAFLVAYNTRENNPTFEHHHASYTPLKKVPNDAILTCDNVSDFSGKDIMDPTMDKTIKATLVKSNFH